MSLALVLYKYKGMISLDLIKDTVRDVYNFWKWKSFLCFPVQIIIIWQFSLFYNKTKLLAGNFQYRSIIWYGPYIAVSTDFQCFIGLSHYFQLNTIKNGFLDFRCTSKFHCEKFQYQLHETNLAFLVFWCFYPLL